MHTPLPFEAGVALPKAPQAFEMKDIISLSSARLAGAKRGLKASLAVI